MDLGYFDVRAARRASAVGHTARRGYYQASRLVRVWRILGLLSVDQPRARLAASAVSRLGRLPRRRARRSAFVANPGSSFGGAFGADSSRQRGRIRANLLAENLAPRSFLAAP